MKLDVSRCASAIAICGRVSAGHARAQRSSPRLPGTTTARPSVDKQRKSDSVVMECVRMGTARIINREPASNQDT